MYVQYMYDNSPSLLNYLFSWNICAALWNDRRVGTMAETHEFIPPGGAPNRANLGTEGWYNQMIYLLKVVIFHSYGALPKGTLG